MDSHESQTSNSGPSSRGSLGPSALANVAKDAQRAAKAGLISSTRPPNFHAHGKDLRFADVSLFCLYPGNVIRETAVWVTQSWIFEGCIL